MAEGTTPEPAAQTQNQILSILGDIAKTAVGNITAKNGAITANNGNPAATQAAEPVDWRKWALYGGLALVAVLVIKKLIG